VRLKGFINGSYSNRSYAADSERTVNLYVELNEQKAAANGEVGCFFGTPGETLLNSLTSSEVTVAGMGFGNGDGAAKTFSLLVSGVAVLTVIGTPTLYKTDWQGTQKLFSTPRTNLILGSSKFDAAPWSSALVTIAQGVSDPAGGMTAATITCTGTPLGGSIANYITGVVAGSPYVNSIWIRRRTGSGVVTLSTPDLVTPTVVPLTSSWKCFSAISTPLVTSIAQCWLEISLSTLGDQIDVAFAQIELNTLPGTPGPTSYIETVFHVQPLFGVTVTDYSFSGIQAVFPTAPAIGSSLSWDGKGTISTGFNGPVRGLYRASNGVLYCVCGQWLYSIDSSWKPTAIGQLSTTTGRVQMDDNSYQLCVVDGGGYVLTFSTGKFISLGGVDGWQGATSVGTIDGWGVFNVPGTNQFYTSNQNDYTTYNGTTTSPSPNYSFKAGQGDPIVSILVDHQTVWLMGQKTIEPWYNAQNPPPGIVLSKYAGALIEVGCCGVHTPQKVLNGIIWLGDGHNGSGIVWQCSGGFVPNRISTHAVETALESYGYANLQNATAWTYEQEGHAFYCLNVPGAPVTWVYDVVTGLWAERSRLANGQEMRHNADCHAYAYGHHVVGDYQASNIYALDLNNNSDNGQPRRWLRRLPHLNQGNKWIIYRAIQLEMQVGIGPDGNTKQPPQVMLRWSDDAGKTWSHYHNCSAGDLGKYNTRAIWRRLGRSRNRVFEFSGSDPVTWALLGAELDVELSSI